MTAAILRAEIGRDFARFLDELERGRAFLVRRPELVEKLSGVVAKLHALKSPIPGAAQLLERAAKLQASVAIARARA